MSRAVRLRHGSGVGNGGVQGPLRGAHVGEGGVQARGLAGVGVVRAGRLVLCVLRELRTRRQRGKGGAVVWQAKRRVCYVRTASRGGIASEVRLALNLRFPSIRAQVLLGWQLLFGEPCGGVPASGR